MERARRSKEKGRDWGGWGRLQPHSSLGVANRAEVKEQRARWGGKRGMRWISGGKSHLPLRALGVLGVQRCAWTPGYKQM
jgi:hypothetical protein